MKNVHIFMLLLISFSPLALTKGESPAKLEKVRLQLKWVHQFQFAGYYAAIEKGFYRDAGLDVELIEGKPGVDFVEEVIAGNAEYGTEVPYLAIERNNGKPLVVLAVIFQHSPHVLLLRGDSEIETPQQFGGKRLMIRVDSTASVVAMFAREGVPLESIEIQKHSWNIDDLINGKTDAMAAYLTDGLFVMDEKGVAWKVMKPITYGIDFYGDCLFTSERQIREHPDQVKVFRQASLAGWKYAFENIDEMIVLIRDKYSSSKTVEALRYEAKEMENLILPDLIEMGHMNPGRWKHIADTYVDLGMLDANYSLDGFIYDPDQKANYHYLWLAIGGVAGVLIAGVLSVMLTHHLRQIVAKRTSELDDSKKRYRAIVQDQTELICRYFPDCTLTFVNDAYCRCFGKKHEELVGESFLQFLSEENRDFVMDGLKGFDQDNQLREWQHQVDLPSGETVWMRWTNRAIFDNQGSIVEFQGAGRDVSEQKKAQEKLLASEQQLKATNQQLLANDQQLRAANQQLLASDQQLRAANQQLHMTQVSVDKAAFEVYWITGDASFMYVNDQACKSLGYSRQELQSLSVPDIDPEFNRDTWKKHWQELKDAGKLTFETVHMRKDKSTYPAEITVNYLEYEGIGYNFAYALDVTERKKAEELFRESQVRYKYLFNEMTSGAALHEIICDSDGKPIDYRFLDINPAFEKMTGLVAEEVIDKSVLEIIPQIEPEWIEKYGDVALTGNSVFFENYSHPLKKHYEVTAYCPEKGHFAVLFHDISERKAAESDREELMRSLEGKNSELQSLVYTVSHDLKSPLVNIKGFSGILCETVDGIQQLLEDDISYEDFKTALSKFLDEDIRESVGFIDSSTDKMKLLLDGLLAVSRVGTTKIYIEKIKMGDMLQEVLKAMRFQIDENHAEITIGDLPDCAGDAGQISSVFTNLIDNAMKYRSLDRKCAIEISGLVENGKTIYCIADNGIGIPENHQSKIFDLFHRLNPDDGVEGQGVGLTIIQRILQRQNGNIRLESVPEKGTKFHIKLPIA